MVGDFLTTKAFKVTKYPFYHSGWKVGNELYLVTLTIRVLHE